MSLRGHFTVDQLSQRIEGQCDAATPRQYSDVLELLSQIAYVRGVASASPRAGRKKADFCITFGDKASGAALAEVSEKLEEAGLRLRN